MKQKDLLKLFSNNGWWILREGANHIIMTNGKDIEPVPRHREVNEQLAKSIIRRRGLK
ncbi:type II toxin-antitoxin system HicA family toxin [uncultured Dysosmobacter sp.]|uniref:type II toxin-antitoxin system HicA family toxin n=1 Tax=uncultured Dysosmobacter sp. TaxID=2591384 RepID=UPI0026261D49|nr:type II toxin-antitoxin system HicA family toxin [uncultured Dysosmobacter sp.]